jgi:hypothetical protein
MKHLKQKSEKHEILKNICNIQIYLCNIQIKRLKQKFETPETFEIQRSSRSHYLLGEELR